MEEHNVVQKCYAEHRRRVCGTESIVVTLLGEYIIGVIKGIYNICTLETSRNYSLLT